MQFDASRLLLLARQCLQAGQIEQAAAHCARVVRQDPDNAAAHHLLGTIAARQGRQTAALEAFARAVELEPDAPDARFAMARAQHELARFEEALDGYERLRHMVARYPGLNAYRAQALAAVGRLEEAAGAYAEALGRDPGNAPVLNNLGNVLMRLNRVEEAIGHYRAALSARPAYARGHSNLLLAMNYLEDRQSEIFSESLRFGARHGQTPAIGSRSECPTDRLRIGYVSPDFRAHSIAIFTLHLLPMHDPARFSVYCYASVVRPDAFTDHFRRQVQNWRDIASMSDETAAALIAEDGIHILVDLAGHTADNRLTLFALKPAPVQVTWLGYPNTTGLGAMDYRLTDAVADPPGRADQMHVEKLVRLQTGFLCYHAAAGDLEVADPPCVSAGHVTFGSFNTLEKITPGVIETWARIIGRVPGARLLLKADGLSTESVRRQCVEAFGRHGVTADRLELLGWRTERTDHLATYHRVDIALDPFPYNGTTTSCDALWMGVPVIVLRGNRHAGRVGASILTRVELEEFVAPDVDGYVALAERLAGDRARLAALRRGLRGRMRASPLMDAPGFVRGLEAAYGAMWENR